MPPFVSSRIQPGTGRIQFPVDETETEAVPLGAGGGQGSGAGGTGAGAGAGTGGNTGSGNADDIVLSSATLGTGLSALSVSGTTLAVRTFRAGAGIALSLNDIGEIEIANTAIGSGGGGSGGTFSGDGFDIVLGDITAKGDGSWSPGAVPFANDLPVSEAMDRMNELLALLVPSQPAELTSRTLVVPSVGASPLLAAGAVTNLTGTTVAAAAGSPVVRITASSVTANTLDDVGPGNSGTISVFVNNVEAGVRGLAGTSDNGTYGALTIADQKDFPVSQPGFWRAVDVGVSAPVEAGWNRLRVLHSANSPQMTNEVFFLRDVLTAAPSVTDPTLVEEAAGTQAFSSSVPHYGTGASVRVGLSISNLAGDAYYGGTDPLAISGSNGIITAQNYPYSALGITTPIQRNTTAPVSISTVVAAVNGTGHTSGQALATARNVNGASTATAVTSTIILIRNGSAGPRIDELSIPVTSLGVGSGNAVRVGLPSGDTPSGATAAWSSTAALPAHEAAVVAGVLSHNVTNYSAGFLPVGPDLSVGRSGAQYVTFAFARSAVSAFRIAVTGTYSGCWIKLPDVSDEPSISPNALGDGWWNAAAAYSGAGVPGRMGDATAGCASGAVMSGGSGNFTITFGTQSSTNAVGNVILVRFRLQAAQSITALSFLS